MADGDGPLTKDKPARGQDDALHRRALRLRRQAAGRPRHEPSLQLDRLLAFRGRRADPHRGEDHGRQHQLYGHGDLGRHRHRQGEEPARARSRSCCTRGMFSPGGTGFDIPGYVSYVAPNQPRVYIDSPYKAYQTIIGVVGTHPGHVSGRQAQQQRAARSKSINDILRPQIQALLARTDLSESDHNRLDQHLTAIRDIEVTIATTTFTIPDADVATMKSIDPKPYDQATHDRRIKLFMELMAFSAAADYSRVAVLKIGDRIDDHVYTYNGQSAKFHDVSHRQVNNAVDFHHYLDRMMLATTSTCSTR